MKEQHNKNTINKIVYFALTSTAETPMGMWLGKQSSFSPSFFFLFVLFFFWFFLPLLAPAHSSLMKLWEFREGSGAAGISPEHKAPWEEQTLARLRRGAGEGRVSVRAYTRECCHTRLIKNFKKWENVNFKSPFADMLPHARSLPHVASPLHANQDVC